MSISDLPDRPVMSSPELGYEAAGSPLGKMPIAACIAGIMSLLTPLSISLLPLSILAAALGAVVLWQQTREANSLGKILAQIGLGLGVATGAWSITATKAESQYLTGVAAKHAKIYLDKIALGSIHEALELRLPIRQRQIAGTNLKEYYEQLTGEAADKVAEVAGAPSTRTIQAAGPSADWQMIRCVRTGSLQTQKVIVLEFADTNTSSEHVEVELRREVFTDETGTIRAQWIVKDVNLPDKNGNPN